MNLIDSCGWLEYSQDSRFKGLDGVSFVEIA